MLLVKNNQDPLVIQSATASTDGAMSAGDKAQLVSLFSYTLVADTDHITVPADARIIYTSLSAPRQVLVSAVTVPPGEVVRLMIKDESLNCDGTNTITVRPAGNGLLDGFDATILNSPAAVLNIYTRDGVNWFTEI